MRLSEMDNEALLHFKNEALERYNEMKAMNLKLDMSRGKPSSEQLELSMDMLTIAPEKLAVCENGLDARNYGCLAGIPEARALFAELLEVPADNVIVGGNSSLAMMYSTVAMCMAKGINGCEPWSRLPEVKFLCPTPGYDRHFAICEYFGIKMLPVEMNENGPDMDEIERIVSSDESVKGIWCVPMYSNPGGVVYSDETVRRFAALKPAARDFRVLWDNAYCVHHLTDNHPTLLNIFDEARLKGNEELFIEFASTSKITFSGAGLAAMVCFGSTYSNTIESLNVHTIGYDKINQRRHSLYFKNAAAVHAHMLRQRAVIAPKFSAVLKALAELDTLGVCSYTKPDGGYFISFAAQDGCAKRIVALCAEAGVKLTGAGAAYPYGNDPRDSNIRIAPTYPPVHELEIAAELFCVCVKLASAEKLLASRA